jgi:ribosomal protein S18 acetylase RimI-like enzyme
MDVHYRSYDRDDLDRCAALAADAWPVASGICQDVPSLMTAYVRLSLLLSDYARVCCIRGEVVGFLFGLTHKTLPGLRARLELGRVLCGFASGKYGSCTRRFRLLMGFVVTLLKVEWSCRRFDCEVELFVVDAEHRGRGLGRSLLGHFVEHLRREKKQTVYLYTNMLSNWKFYERYGFVRHAEFYDNQLSFLKGAPTYGWIYCYRL